MQNAIEIAIENEFDIMDILRNIEINPEQFRKYNWYTSKYFIHIDCYEKLQTGVQFHQYSFAHLIFSTNFIDKVIGKREGYEKMLAKQHRSKLANMTNEEQVAHIKQLAGVSE